MENESNVEGSSDREGEGEEIASLNGSEAEVTQESDNDTENDSQETESSSTIGTITARFVLYVISRSPRREITSKTTFFGVTNVEQLKTKMRRRWKPIFTLLLQRRAKEMTDF